jgi:hypothetical protein
MEVPSMWGVKVEPLAKLGLYTRKMISRCFGTRPLVERAHWAIFDLQPTGTVAAS